MRKKIHLKRKLKNNNQKVVRGFTLVEVLAVVVIIEIVSGVVFNLSGI